MKLKLKHLLVAISSLFMSSCANTNTPSPSHSSDESELEDVTMENNDDSTLFAVSGDESNSDIIEAPEYANDTYLRCAI